MLCFDESNAEIHINSSYLLIIVVSNLTTQIHIVRHHESF